jgi:hypothetical protein
LTYAAQALNWFRDERPDLETVVEGIVRHLQQEAHKQSIIEGSARKHPRHPAWVYPAVEIITCNLHAEMMKKVRR